MMVFMRILNALITIYILVIFFRLILTWFSLSFTSPAINILRSITDPYLNYFRRFKFLMAGRIDFSPIAAIMVLVVVQDITRILGTTGRLSIGILLAVILSAAWSGFAFVLHFFIVVIIIRFLSLMVGRQLHHPIWQTLDFFIQPIAERVSGLFSPGKVMAYTNLLLVTGIMFAVVAIGGRIIISLLTGILMRLPL